MNINISFPPDTHKRPATPPEYFADRSVPPQVNLVITEDPVVELVRSLTADGGSSKYRRCPMKATGEECYR